MLDYAEQAIASWKAENIQLGGGLDETTLIASFESVDWSPSADVLGLYRRCSGMLPLGADDKSLFSFWPFAQAVARSAEVSKPYFSFGEGFLSAQRYCFRGESTEKSSVYGDYFDGRFTKLTDSVEEFFECLLTRPKEIWLPS